MIFTKNDRVMKSRMNEGNRVVLSKDRERHSNRALQLQQYNRSEVTKLRKIKAVLSLKTKMLLGNTAAITGPLMAIAITIAMRFLYGSLTSDPADASQLYGLALSLGMAMNIGMGAVMMTALPLAEDKEKHTLRTLMTSSVNGSQFFIGSIVPPFIITVITNFIIVLVSGADLSSFQILPFTWLMTTASLISCMIGLVIGLIAKSQVNANNLMMPIIMLLALFPTFGEFNETLARMSDYLYTGMVKAYSVGGSYKLSPVQYAILATCILVVAGFFIHHYKKSILEND